MNNVKSRLRRLGSRLIFGLIVALCANAVDASECDRAASFASKKKDVPLELLHALTRVETGRTVSGAFAPWPWAVNVEGKGYWFQTREEAVRFANKILQSGGKNFDVGCFQINIRWHGHRFNSIEAMFDPIQNASYAADYLMRMYDETEDWNTAIGAYHSKTPDLAAKYLKRFQEILTQSPGHRVARNGLTNQSFGQLFGRSSDPSSIGSLVPAKRNSDVTAFIQF